MPGAEVTHSQDTLGVKADARNGQETPIVDHTDVKGKRLAVQERLGDAEVSLGHALEDALADQGARNHYNDHQQRQRAEAAEVQITHPDICPTAPGC